MIKTQAGNFENIAPQKQHRIICAALAAFSDLGFDKASVEDITFSAGISKSLLFHYFGSKQGLFDYCLAFAEEAVSNALSGSAPNSRDFFDILISYELKRLNISKEYPRIFDFCERFSVPFSPTLDEALKGASTSAFKFRTNLRYVTEICCAVSDAQIKKAPAEADAEDELTQKLLLLKSGFYREGFI